MQPPVVDLSSSQQQPKSDSIKEQSHQHHHQQISSHIPLLPVPSTPTSVPLTKKSHLNLSASAASSAVPAAASTAVPSAIPAVPSVPTAAASSEDLPKKAKSDSSPGNSSNSNKRRLSSNTDASSALPTSASSSSTSQSQPHPPPPKKSKLISRLRGEDVVAAGLGGRAASSPSLVGDPADDPYSFEEEERGASIQYTRFGGSGGKGSGAAPSPTPSSSSSAPGPVYKFKSALLSRRGGEEGGGGRANSTDSRTSNASASSSTGGSGTTTVPRLRLEGGGPAFEAACSSFLDDLNGRSVAVSLRPNMDTYRERLAARRERNANRGRKKKVAVGEDGGEDKDEEEEREKEDESRDLDSSLNATVLSSGSERTPSKKEIFSDEEAPLKPPSSKAKKSKATSSSSEVPSSTEESSSSSQKVKKTPGRKKGSKNKKTLEREKMAALEMAKEQHRLKDQEEALAAPPSQPAGQPSLTAITPAVEAEKKADKLQNGATSSVGVQQPGTFSESSSKPKKGGLWAMPIVPKLPQKKTEKKPGVLRATTTPAGVIIPSIVAKPAAAAAAGAKLPASASAANKKDVDLSAVWRQAFGAKTGGAGGKSESSAAGPSKVKSDPDSSSSGKGGGGKTARSLRDVPPEARRRSRPPYGGLIHFAPDWEQRVGRHHAKCRLPDKVRSKMMAKPKILRYEKTSAALSPVKERFEARPPSASPPHASPPSSSSSPASTSAKIEETIPCATPSSSSSASVVDAILEKRRMRAMMDRSRVYKQRSSARKPPVAFDQLEEGLGLLPTPGLPLITQDNTTDVMLGGNFGNFRRQTLLRYLDSLEDSAELKAKLLDWRPEVLETKTRRQSNKVKTATNHKEIFGLDLPTARAAKEEAEAVAAVKAAQKEEEEANAAKAAAAAAAKAAEAATAASAPETTVTTPKKGKKSPKKSKKETTSSKGDALKDGAVETKAQVTPVAKPAEKKTGKEKHEEKVSDPKSSSKKKKKKLEKSLSLPADTTSTTPTKNKEKEVPPASSSLGPLKKTVSLSHPVAAPSLEERKREAKEREEAEEDYEPSKEEEELQVNLQTFALDLLDDNLSWSNKAVIQNLVIWEPVEPPPGAPGLPPPPPLTKYQKYKKYKKKTTKRRSGLDFSSKKKGSTKSRDASRAGTPEKESTEGSGVKGPPKPVKYTLENVDHECRELVS